MKEEIKDKIWCRWITSEAGWVWALLVYFC